MNVRECEGFSLFSLVGFSRSQTTTPTTALKLYFEARRGSTASFSFVIISPYISRLVVDVARPLKNIQL
jgi:hypothetical protein